MLKKVNNTYKKSTEKEDFRIEFHEQDPDMFSIDEHDCQICELPYCCGIVELGDFPEKNIVKILENQQNTLKSFTQKRILKTLDYY